MISVLAYAGLRPREIRALRWSDVGADAIRVKDGTGPGRTVRNVRLLAPLAEDLWTWREACEAPGDEAPVFRPRPGVEWNIDEWRNWQEHVFEPALEASGLQELLPFNLRNALLRLMLLDGTPTETLAAQMGLPVDEVRERYEPMRRDLLAGLQEPIPADEEIRVARRRSPLDDVPPHQLFGAVSGDAWRWLNLEGRERCSFLERYLPSLTGDPDFEEMLTATGGLATGYVIYELFKRIYEQHAQPLVPESRVLDFGCGWGRIIRFFLKDVAPERLVGVDRFSGARAASRQTNRWSRFVGCETLPPTDLEPESFDLIYAYSVFSHLSEESHLRWLAEFERLLRPGGILIVTTFPRAVLEGTSPEVAGRFEPLDLALDSYDRGEYCYRVHRPDDPHYGDTLIPEAYVRANWGEHLAVLEYLPSPGVAQNVVVCKKR